MLVRLRRLRDEAIVEFSRQHPEVHQADIGRIFGLTQCAVSAVQRRFGVSHRANSWLPHKPAVWSAEDRAAAAKRTFAQFERRVEQGLPRHPFTGRKHSAEARRKMSATRKLRRK